MRAFIDLDPALLVALLLPLLETSDNIVTLIEK